MKNLRNAAPTTRWLLASMLGLAAFLAACFAAAPRPAFAADAAAPAAGAASDSGLVIYIDPQTGALLDAPAPGAVPLQLTPQLRNALSTSHEGLVEVPNPGPGGGFKLDLQGRFQSPLIVTIGADGKTRMQHLGEPAGSSDTK